MPAEVKKRVVLDSFGDFTTTWRVLPLSLLAIAVGIFSAFVALALLRLIGIFTNLLFFQRWGTALVSPANNHLGWMEILVPIFGGLIVGIMARYGSERIRGHGIPEALEAILLKGGKIEPRVAILKPLSSAISIGSGGPFGAEGPIIMTGGAFGSLIAQFCKVTSAERKVLLVAGAAAGMSATFAAPLSSVLLSVELLLFEWKPRSLVPVGLASVAAAVTRRYIIGMGPLFPTVQHPAFIGPRSLLACALLGVMAGVLSALLTVSVYAAEDAFGKLPIHWMWWPAIGGLVVGAGGLVFPQALGVGYDMIGLLLQGDGAIKILLGILLVKSTMWAIALGSGTSGGVLAPLLMMGGALGGLCAQVLPNNGPGFWPLIGMGAILGGTMRSPFTGIVFSIELTHDVNMILPLLLACVISHGFTVLTLRRSILTEKVARRGYLLSREYSVDPLELTFVREVMRADVVTISSNVPGVKMAVSRDQAEDRLQRLYPVVDGEKRLLGVVPRHELEELLQRGDLSGDLSGVMHRTPVVAYPDEPLLAVVQRMATSGHTRLPVVSHDDERKFLGMIALQDLLKARARNLKDETARERVLALRFRFAARTNDKKSA